MMTLDETKVPLLILEGLENSQPTRLHGLQALLEPYTNDLIAGWWFIFFVVSFAVLFVLGQRVFAVYGTGK
jgi:hypothetical protein